ncbi:MAG: hypothetical protein LBL38_02190 [Lactobacillales bacterium]|jgi:aspartate 4-decarboxylase|nr:hypothetical protein [Lactobacillales bacterium]
MDGVGFGANPGILRISQANLTIDAYKTIGKKILELLSEYYEQFSKEERKTYLNKSY